MSKNELKLFSGDKGKKNIFNSKDNKYTMYWE